MKKTLLLSTLIALASSNVNASEAKPEACPSKEDVIATILGTASEGEFKERIAAMGYPVEQILSSRNYHSTDWAKFQKVVREDGLKRAGRPCYYSQVNITNNQEFGVVLSPKKD